MVICGSSSGSPATPGGGGISGSGSSFGGGGGGGAAPCASASPVAANSATGKRQHNDFVRGPFMRDDFRPILAEREAIVRSPMRATRARRSHRRRPPHGYRFSILRRSSRVG